MSAAAFSYRPMAEDDLDWVLRHEPALYPFPWTRGNFEDSLSAGYSCWIMAEGDVPIAYAVVMQIVDEAHLLNFSVVRSAQGRGVGAALLDFLRHALRHRGVTQFFLEVRPSNLAARAVYEKAGFASIGRRKGYYPAENGREDALVMRVAP
ncbi:ribosomal protein S18-alanine N-acetyltransferase [Denitromonas ohlonensis]|jgi:ribosomal-protein-alanine N-acetyltransferase|uniref:[Ribosomal protein bS18]-alanine N-acetyltransferase n=2 Tax=Denitromonas TaxID=139331 RepID=A0A558CNC7_9RHOO|nr:ribosomal protein S18-alanine N-acetyltransferase [Denitromonas ohlonensis]TVT50258.1 MAG: ribosomal-protein-alanine N-acetyltransferase [Denitromonas halophila]TVO69244.1 ribosomal-protein-alanine N-acetyltransferase [Denitromonas ohlonensis]TVO77344.1 ribosomal-protein-alanine N-acetyltransferase [Denitromonas ohlonensis]TVT74929.1 MAG: ribosomal-protein-alanine N-acetyltransferase [Denitromonas halophila]TVT78034.1 MAG: ribosomal-protein-alanine N-acetyltransferase [Denitromonas halophil